MRRCGLMRGVKQVCGWLIWAALVGPGCGARTALQDAQPQFADLPRLPTCGNHIVEGEEACDDGNTADTDGCTTQCELARCGDGLVFAGIEACDDGASEACKGCAPLTCGDGKVDAGEECDDGNGSNADACPSTCLRARCGDGVVLAGTEECDEGPGNATQPALMITQGQLQIAVRPVEQPRSVEDFYSYSSASSHTGFEQASQSLVFLYRDTLTGQLSLIFIHGKDGSEQPEAAVDMQILHLPPETFVPVADDTGDEFTKHSPTSAQGAWRFHNNTDGGVLSGLPFPGRWDVDIVPDFQQGIGAWSFLDGGKPPVSLDTKKTLIISAFDAAAGCRPDCKRPRCGDGVLDGGEECDDGNKADGDGCSASCLRP